MARVVLTPSAEKEALRLPEAILERLRKILRRLEKWPDVSGAKPLTGNMAGFYRMRTGAYRIRFSVRDETVIVDKIGHRSKFYES